ncbi:unnamed protein product [Linum trigynum]|uniref:Uncharacterized protein n=1 Tax=Linum trigynum TaxID=586398 RepID=A0AAV2DA82_9ROSI
MGRRVMQRRRRQLELWSVIERLGSNTALEKWLELLPPQPPLSLFTVRVADYLQLINSDRDGSSGGGLLGEKKRCLGSRLMVIDDERRGGGLLEEKKRVREN